MMICLYQFILRFNFIGSIALFFSCNSATQDQKQDSIVRKPNGDTLIHIPGDITDSSDSSYYTRDMKMLNIDDLRKGAKELQIRIWATYALSDSCKVIILKKKNKIWNAAIYYFKYHYNKKNEIDSISKSIDENDPISGWDKFLIKIDELEISNLKDYKNIPGYNLCHGGDQITVEIADYNKYQFNRYPCWNINEDTIKEVIPVKQFLSLLQNELGFKLFPRPELKI